MNNTYLYARMLRRNIKYQTNAEDIQISKVMKANESVDFFSVHSREEVAEIDKRIEQEKEAIIEHFKNAMKL